MSKRKREACDGNCSYAMILKRAIFLSFLHQLQTCSPPSLLLQPDFLAGEVDWTMVDLIDNDDAFFDFNETTINSATAAASTLLSIVFP